MLSLPSVWPPGADSPLFTVGTNSEDEAAAATNSNSNFSATASSKEDPCDKCGKEENGEEDSTTILWPSSNKRPRDGEGDEEALLMLSSLDKKHANAITLPSDNLAACKKEVHIFIDQLMKQVEVTIDEIMALKQENAVAVDAHAEKKEMLKCWGCFYAFILSR